jgi:hypothetical protein
MTIIYIFEKFCQVELGIKMNNWDPFKLPFHYLLQALHLNAVKRHRFAVWDEFFINFSCMFLISFYIFTLKNNNYTPLYLEICHLYILIKIVSLTFGLYESSESFTQSYLILPLFKFWRLFIVKFFPLLFICMSVIITSLFLFVLLIVRVPTRLNPF